MLENREFWLVMNKAGSVLVFGDPAADAEGRYPNRETAEASVERSGALRDGETLYIVKSLRTIVAEVTGTTSITITPV